MWGVGNFNLSFGECCIPTQILKLCYTIQLSVLEIDGGFSF